MISEANTPSNTSPVYIVYAHGDSDPSYEADPCIYHITHNISEARAIAQDRAKDNPGVEIYIATRTNIFVAETTVRER